MIILDKIGRTVDRIYDKGVSLRDRGVDILLLPDKTASGKSKAVSFAAPAVPSYRKS